MTTVASTVFRSLFPVCGCRISKRPTAAIRRNLVTIATSMSNSAVAKATSICASAALRIDNERHQQSVMASSSTELSAALQLCAREAYSPPAAAAATTTGDAVGIASVCGRRNTNEDRTLVRRLSSDLLLVGIFDGHGGSEAVEFVCDRLPGLLTYWLDQDGGDLQSALRHAFAVVNDQLTNALNEQPDVTIHDRVPAAIKSQSCGTTATVCLLRRNSELVVAQVGDSRATLCRGGVGQVLTADHSPDDPLELERILRCSGHVTQTSFGRPRVNGILEMTRSIGDIGLKRFGVTAEPDIITIELDSSDEFLTLTTDGIHNTLNVDEIVGAVSDRSDAADAAGSIAEDAMFYGSTDNCTALVLPLAAWNRSSLSSGSSSSRIVTFRRAHNAFGNRM